MVAKGIFGSIVYLDIISRLAANLGVRICHLPTATEVILAMFCPLSVPAGYRVFVLLEMEHAWSGRTRPIFLSRSSPPYRLRNFLQRCEYSCSRRRGWRPEPVYANWSVPMRRRLLSALMREAAHE